jgi:hypothetical protein
MNDAELKEKVKELLEGSCDDWLKYQEMRTQERAIFPTLARAYLDKCEEVERLTARVKEWDDLKYSREAAESVIDALTEAELARFEIYSRQDVERVIDVILEGLGRESKDG